MFFVVFFLLFLCIVKITSVYRVLLSPLKFSFTIHRSAIGRFKCQVKIVSNLSNSTIERLSFTCTANSKRQIQVENFHEQILKTAQKTLMDKKLR